MAAEVSGDFKKLLEEYASADILAEEIIGERHQISNLDGKRNSAREALRHLKKSSSAEKASAWVCFGNTFIKMDSHECVKMLEQEHKELEAEMERLRQSLKVKVAALHNVEGQPEAKGFDLQGMRITELINT